MKQFKVLGDLSDVLKALDTVDRDDLTKSGVNEILNIATLGGTTNSSLATYAYTNVVADDETAAVSSGLVSFHFWTTSLDHLLRKSVNVLSVNVKWSPGPGGSLAIASTANFAVANGATATPLALLADVDLLRVAMLNAIQALSTKLDEIVNKATLSC